jgi:putative colanic acid biosynthesis acetyltransferase WcaF
MQILDAKRSSMLEGGPSFSLRQRLFRASWSCAWLFLAAWTPAPLHRWRNFLLRIFGARLHPTALVYGSVRVWYPPHLTMGPHAVMGPRVNCYCQDLIAIGEKAIVSQGAQLCAGTHDISDPNFQLVTKPISIEARAWIAAEAFVGPGVTVGEGAVLGACAVLFKDAEPWGVYIGNPAQRIKMREFRRD